MPADRFHAPRRSGAAQLPVERFTHHLLPAEVNAGGHAPLSAQEQAGGRAGSCVIRTLLDALATQDASWVKRHRAINTLGLFAIIAAKRGRRDPVWKGQADIALLSSGHVPVANVNPASISKALKRLPEGTFQRVHEHLTTHMLTQPSAILRPPPSLRRIYAVDSTKVSLPPKMAALGYRPMQREGASPKLTLSTIIDVRTGILVACDYSSSFDERAALCRLVARHSIPPDTILLADRGYYSKHVWLTLTQHRIHPLFRCRSNADSSIHTAFEKRRKTQSLVLHGVPAIMHRWATARDGKRSKRWPRRAMQPQPPPNHLLHAHDLRPDVPEDGIPKGQELVLVSSLDFSRQEAVETYQLRWQVETAYNINKNILGLGKNEGAPHTVTHTLQALVLLHTFLRLIEIKNDANRVYNQHGTLGTVWTHTSTHHHRTACLILALALTHPTTQPRPHFILVTMYIPQPAPPPPPPPPPPIPWANLGNGPPILTSVPRRRRSM